MLVRGVWVVVATVPRAALSADLCSRCALLRGKTDGREAAVLGIPERSVDALLYRGQMERVVLNLYFLICVEPTKVFLLASLPRQNIYILF